MARETGQGSTGTEREAIAGDFMTDTLARIPGRVRRHRHPQGPRPGSEMRTSEWSDAIACAGAIMTEYGLRGERGEGKVQAERPPSGR